MNKPNTYEASDYAGLGAKNASFYYGSEQAWCPVCNAFFSHPASCDDDHPTECCFVATIGGKDIKIPFSKLGGRDQWECRENLLLGIGWILAKYHLKLEP